MHAIARYVDVAFFPPPAPVRPTRHEPLRDRRPKRSRRGIVGILRSIFAAPPTAPFIPTLRDFPR